MLYYPSRILIVTIILLNLASRTYAAEVILHWDANTEPNLAGYKIYYKIGSPGQPYRGTGLNEGVSPIDVGNNTTYRLSGVDETETYYFVVTAYDTMGFESGFSSDVCLGCYKTKNAKSLDSSSGDTNHYATEIASVALPSGVVLQLSRKQVDAIKRERGVFYGIEAADMLSAGEVVVKLPAGLGGGYIYGKPEHLAQAFAAVHAIKGNITATHLFEKRRFCLWF